MLHRAQAGRVAVQKQWFEAPAPSCAEKSQCFSFFESRALESVRSCDGNKGWVKRGWWAGPPILHALLWSWPGNLGQLLAITGIQTYTLFIVFVQLWIFLLNPSCCHVNMLIVSLNVIVLITKALWTLLPAQAQVKPHDGRVKEVRARRRLGSWSTCQDQGQDQPFRKQATQPCFL